MFHLLQTLPGPFLIHDLLPDLYLNYMTVVTSGARIAYPSGAPEFIPGL